MESNEQLFYSWWIQVDSWWVLGGFWWILGGFLVDSDGFLVDSGCFMFYKTQQHTLFPLKIISPTNN